jgi:hypothetical protein
VRIRDEFEDVVEEFERKGGEMVDLESGNRDVSELAAAISYQDTYLLSFSDIHSSRS